MSDKQKFQREIKRTGYLRGTQMRKVRTKFLIVVMSLTVASYIGGYFWINPDENKTYKLMQKEKKWKAERERRLAQIIQMKNELDQSERKPGHKE